VQPICTLAVLLLVTATAPYLYADAAALLAEPYGRFGRMNPTGHAAVYLNRICAASPTKLRRCGSGEYGVVISRYSNTAGYDWVAVPLIPYLYAVKRASEVPASADAETVSLLRDSYRRRYLRDLIPDDSKRPIPEGGWYQLVGAAYDRKLFAFEIETSEEQDEEFIRAFNSRRNRSRFNLLYRNCADFARDVINFYYPKAVKRSIVADVGITTPKQVAKSLVRYSKKHPELQFSSFIIPQVPGNRPPSKRTRGVLESLIKSKKYAAPLIAINLWLIPTLAAGYFTTGRFNPSQYAETEYGPVQLEERVSMVAHSVLHKSTTSESAALDGGVRRLGSEKSIGLMGLLPAPASNVLIQTGLE
jgi:hypothetical protein